MSKLSWTIESEDDWDEPDGSIYSRPPPNTHPNPPSFVELPPDMGDDDQETGFEHPCPNCGGSGQAFGQFSTCLECDGEGYL